MSSAAAIIARLGLDSGEFRADLAASRSAYEAEEKKMTAAAKEESAKRVAAHREAADQFKSMAGQLAGAAGLTFGADTLISAGKAAIEYAGQLQDTADAIGVNVETLQQLEFAFGQSGAGADDVRKGLTKLNQTSVDARDGNEKLITSYAQLGVSLKDLKELTPDQLLMKIAASAGEAHDPSERLSAILDVLGKSGGKMAGGLNGGVDSLRALRDEATILSSGEVGSLATLGDNLDKFGSKAKAYVGKFLLGGADPFGQAIRGMEERARNSPGVTRDSGEQFGPDAQGFREQELRDFEADQKKMFETVSGYRAQESEQRRQFEEASRADAKKSADADMDLDRKLAEARRAELKKQIDDGNKIFLEAEEKKRAAKKKAAEEEAKDEEKAAEKKAKEAERDKQEWIDDQLAGPDARREGKREMRRRKQLDDRYDREADLRARRGKSEADYNAAVRRGEKVDYKADPQANSSAPAKEDLKAALDGSQALKDIKDEVKKIGTSK